MALKPTIYKIHVELADSDRNCFESLSLTLARHPSETLERMLVRLLAYCLNYERGMEFTKGISTADEPDLWVHADHGDIEHWIEVGQPESARLRKACGRVRQEYAHLVEIERRANQRITTFARLSVRLGGDTACRRAAGSYSATQHQHRGRHYVPRQWQHLYQCRAASPVPERVTGSGGRCRISRMRCAQQH
jgi:uncharacterized protein YaeQ